MRDDYLVTGQCNFDLLKKNYMDLDLTWGVPKGSPYLNDFNKGYVIVLKFRFLISKF